MQSYKPAWPTSWRRATGCGIARWLHAAQSNFHDIVPANALGVPTAWINRLAERPLPEGEPTFEYPDMASFAAAMTERLDDG